MKNNKKQRNDFEYEALLKSEGEKINNAKFDFQPPSEDFQKSLKMKILEKRREKSDNNMRKIFEILTFPLKPKYSVSIITLAMILFVGLNIAFLSQEQGENIISFTYERVKNTIL